MFIKEGYMSLSLFFQQCPVCPAHLTCMVYEMEDKWQYSCCFVEYYFKDLFKIARSICSDTQIYQFINRLFMYFKNLLKVFTSLLFWTVLKKIYFYWSLISSSLQAAFKIISSHILFIEVIIVNKWIKI